MTAPTKPPVWSGFCNVGRHTACRGHVDGHPCPCDCHQEPEPELTAADLYATVTHSAGVASVGYGGKLAQAVCSCGWAAAEARQRNHDAFDDARAHLAAASTEMAA